MADDVETIPAPKPETAPAPLTRRDKAKLYYESLGKGDQKEAHRLNQLHKLGFSDANVPDAL